MPFVRQAALALLTMATLFCGACGDPPEKEMQQAEGAIAAARTAGADRYAHEELAAAETSLKRARDAVDQRDYRLALNYALDSRERAQSAAKEAGDRKATARGDADRALADASAALTEARLKLKAAETARVPPARLADARTAIAAGEQAVQEASTTLGTGDDLAAIATATGATSRLQAVTRDLDSAVTPPTRRRR